MRHSYIAGYDLCMREGERGVGGVSSKYFWLTQYWLLLVTLVQLSQLFSIFTTSPRSPNHSQSRVCKYLTLIELNSPFSGWRRHLWDACSLSPGVWGQTININTLSINIFSIFLAFVSGQCIMVCWLCRARGLLRADPSLATARDVCSGNIWPSSNLYLCYNLETNCGNKEL